jgi:hypothetical protein
MTSEKNEKNSIIKSLNPDVYKLWSKTTEEKEKQSIIHQILLKIEGILDQIVHKREGSKVV